MATNRPYNPVDRRIAIMDLYDSGQYYGPCTVEDLVSRIGGTSQSITRALQALGFEIVRRRSQRRVKTGKGNRTKKIDVHRQWGKPEDWPETFKLQRRLRKGGLSVGQAQTVIHSGDVPNDILESAMNHLLVSDIPLAKRGELKKAINQLLNDERDRYQRRSIPVADVARALRESPYLPPVALLNRIEGLLRAATRNQEI